MSLKSVVFSLLPQSLQHKIIIQKTGQRIIPNAAITPSIQLEVVISPRGNTWVNRLAKPYGHEPEVVKWFERNLKDSDVVFDIGAHYGFYGILSTQLCPNVKFYGFEGNWFNISYQEFNKQRSPNPQNWKTINKMVGSQPGKDFVTVNQFVAKGEIPTVFLMDVDGEEVSVLQGAKDLIQKGETTFLIEVHPKDLKERGKTVEQTLEFFSDEIYAKAYLPDLRSETSQWQPEINQVEKSDEFYFLATPKNNQRK